MLLQAVDLALDGRVLPLAPQPLDDPCTSVRIGDMGLPARSQWRSRAGPPPLFRRSRRTDGENPLFSFSWRARSSTDRAGKPLEIAVLQAASAASARSGWCTSSQISPFSALVTCPKLGISRAVRVVWRCAAACRISARTTSSVTRALCARRSAKRSRTVTSGIRPAIGNISDRNLTRPSSVFRLWPAAARSSRNSRYGRDCFNRSP